MFPHRLGCELNSPLVAVVTSRHPGDLPARGSFLKASVENVIASVMKAAEDGDGIVVRAFETHGLPAKCSFDLDKPRVSWSADFSPCEIKTFRITGDGVTESNLMEIPLS